MKRTALIVLTVIYLVSCVGISITSLYCCGKMASVSFSYGADDSPSNQTNNSKHCCGHEKQSFKIKDNHVTSASLSLNHPLPAIVSSFTRPGNEQAANLSNTFSVYRGNAPPRRSVIPVYTLHCTYRI